MSERVKGATSVSLEFRLADATTGAAKTGATVTALKLQYVRPGEAPSTATSLTALAAQTTPWTAYGAIEQDATNSPGVFRVDAPNAAFASAAGIDEVVVTITGTGIQPASRLIDLTATDARNAASGGITNLDAAVSSRSTYAGGAVASVTAGVTVSDKTGFALSATGLNAIAGFKGWNFPQMLRALVAFVVGKRAGVPASGTGGSVTYTDSTNGDYGTVTVDTSGNITANAMTPPA